MNKVLLIVIDALASRIVQPAMESGRLPHMQSLIDAGWVNWNSTAIFPSITPAATAALITGRYPRDTGITGAYFFDTKLDRVHYYGDDFWLILRKGFGNFFEEFLVELNDRQLRSKTLYQAVEGAGGRGACLNFLWFHGEHEHKVHVPLLMKLWPTVPFSKTVRGPEWLALGDFVQPRIGDKALVLQGKGGLGRRYGFSDGTTSEMLLKLAEHGPLPELTVAYFPDNDFTSHSEGPRQALPCVEAVDQLLGQMIANAGGLEKFLSDVSVVITGDHSQSDLPHGEDHTGIVVDELLHGFRQAAAGVAWGEDDEVMACPNMRAAQFYLRPAAWPRRYELTAALLADERIDQVIWYEQAAGELPHYFVATQDRGRLEFWPDADRPLARDGYGAGWSWRGDLATVDGQAGDDDVITFGDYPNAFERIVTSFNERVTGDVWATSRVGYEFRLNVTGVSSAGSHGSLHALDSLSPLIVAGRNVPRWQQTPRSVDIYPLCCELLGLATDHHLGASHVPPPRDART